MEPLIILKDVLVIAEIYPVTELKVFMEERRKWIKR